MFFEMGGALYSAFLQNKPTATVPDDFVDIARQVARRVGWSMVVHGKPCKGVIGPINANKKVIVALSGGLDSVYMMHTLKDAGNEVIAVHVSGLNKSSSKYELEAARACAHEAGVKFIAANFNAPRQTFPDNPFKNQLILSMLLDIGVKMGVYRYALGSDWTTPLSEAVVGFTITDSIEVNRAFWAGVQKHFPQAELIFIPDNIKKVERLRYLYDKKALNSVSSCIAPLRFRESWHKTNEQKYGIHLMKGRCGSCYKCAMEYILLVENGQITKNPKFYEHSWDILANSKTAHRPDLFAKGLPLAKRLANLKNYGS